MKVSVKSNLQIITVLFLFVLLQGSFFSYSENADSAKQVSHFSGSVLLTNKGISLIPSLTLGKPAAIFDFSVGKGKLRFEPQFRFGLEGKPWSFIFWWRCQLVDNSRFRFHIGTHPALSFKTEDLSASGGSVGGMTVRRYLAGELAPTYSLSKNIKIGVYYLYARGIEKEIAGNTHYLALQSSISTIRISDQFYLGISPQAYYLRIWDDDGIYVASSFSLIRKNFPLSCAALINQKINSQIAGDRFIWNASLIYSFGKKYKSL